MEGMGLYFRALLIAILFFSSIAAWANDLPLYLRSTRVWDNTNGLPHNTAQAITQTNDGYIWVATWEGLARFNGHQWKVFDRENIPGLSDSGIRALWAGKDGRLWVGSARDGLFSYHEGIWSAIPHENELGQAQIISLFEDAQKRIWIATASNTVLALQADGSLQRYPIKLPAASNTAALAFEQDRHGDIWLATRAGLAKFEKDHFALTSLSSHPTHSVSAIAKNALGDLWVITNRGLYRQQDKQFIAVPGGEDIGNRVPAESLLVEAEDRIVFGTQSAGLFCLCKGKLEQFNTKNGLVNNRIAALFLDQEKSLWVGTNLGVTRIAVGQITRYSRHNGLSDDYVRAVVQDSDNNHWVATSAGLNQIKNDKIQQWSVEQGLASDALYALLKRDANQLWIGTADAGINILQDGKFRSIAGEQGLPSMQVRSLVADGEKVWAGLGERSGGGVALIENERVSQLFGKNLAVRTLFLDSKKRLWVGSTSGIYFIENNVIQEWKKPGLNLQYAFAFYEDERGVLWVAADNGLYRIENNQVTELGMSRGIPNVPILGVTGKSNKLWLCTNKGVVQLDREPLDAIANGTEKILKINAVDQPQGSLAHLQCNGGGNPMMLLDGNLLWYATANGMALMNIENKEKVHAAPMTLIESISTDGIPVADIGHSVFKPGVRRIDFSFSAPTFIAPEQVRYRVRLEGFDENWQVQNLQNQVSYTNLPPGQYTLNIEADNGFGQWSGKVLQYPFELQPYFWQRWSFWCLMLTLIGAAMFAIYRYARKRNRTREQELETLVKDRTLEIQNYAKSLEKVSADRENLLATLEKQAEGLAKLVSEDALTGLANRRMLDLSYKELFEDARRQGRPLSVGVADIDSFKDINDTYGHEAGDEVIRQVAFKLKNATRGRDLVARLGGDEFVLIFPGMSAESTAEVCDRLCRDIASLDFSANQQSFKITMSIGVSDSPVVASLGRLIADADRALYEAKKSGRNRVVVRSV